MSASLFKKHVFYRCFLMRQKQCNLPSKSVKKGKNDDLAAEGWRCPKIRLGFSMLKCVVFGAVRQILSVFISVPVAWREILSVYGGSTPWIADFVAIYCVPAPWKEILVIFTVFPRPG